MRAWWAVLQATFCGVAVFIAQLTAFLYASSRNARFSPFDIFMKPIEIWKPTLRALPKNAWRVCLFVWSEIAVLCALLIIGRISYSALFDDWGVKERATPNLTQAIIDQARQNSSSGDESLGDAMNQFAGEAKSKDKSKNKTPLKPKLLTADCLIFGYTTSNKDEIDTLLLATTVKNDLKFVGMIAAAGIPESARSELAVRLPTLRQKRPFVKCRYSDKWLRPVLMCQVEFKRWGPNNRIHRPKFTTMLRDFKAK